MTKIFNNLETKELLEVVNNVKVQQIANNQFVIFCNGSYIFQSYNSTIAKYTPKTKKLYVYKDWDYSRTTLKYLKNFIENFTFMEYDSKAKFEKKLNDEKEENYILIA